MALLSCRFPIQGTVDLDKNDAGKLGPFFSVGYPVEFSTGPASADLFSTAALVRCFAEVERIKEVDADPIANIEPFRVVVHVLCHERHAGHESKGGDVVHELVLSMEFAAIERRTW